MPFQVLDCCSEQSRENLAFATFDVYLLLKKHVANFGGFRKGICIRQG